MDRRGQVSGSALIAQLRGDHRPVEFLHGSVPLSRRQEMVDRLQSGETPVLVISASLVGTAILAEASLSFLGLGVPPPEPTWGNLLGGQNRDLFEVAPWLAIFPGLAITATVLAFNLFGDALRDLFDPRTRGKL